METKPLVCPLCHKDDALQMVSAVFFDHQNALARQKPLSEQDAALANKLAPPSPPRPPISGFIVIAIQIGLLVLTVLAFQLIQIRYEGPSNWFILPFLLTAFILDRFVFTGSARRRRFEKREILFSKKKRIWGRLYYCHRDQLVFDTRTPVRGQPKDINGVIHKIIRFK